MSTITPLLRNQIRKFLEEELKLSNDDRLSQLEDALYATSQNNRDSYQALVTDFYFAWLLGDERIQQLYNDDPLLVASYNYIHDSSSHGPATKKDLVEVLKEISERVDHDMSQEDREAIRTNCISRCRNKECKSTDVQVNQRQIRGGDEPMTSFFTCNACGKKWREG